jgi:hypothetical protein
MWAQLIKMRKRSDAEGDLSSVFEQLQALEQPGSGLLRTITMQDQKDPLTVYTLVVFDSEEHARAREQDPRRAEGLKAVQASMAQVFEGSPEFVDLDVLVERTP